MNTSTEPPRQRPEAELADRLHSAAIHLLRRLRVHDQASGLTGPRLSALSVVVFAGPLSMGDLAAAEQVRPPTVSRMVRELEMEGLVRRVADPSDGRVLMVEATAEGVRILQEGRRRRVEALAARIAELGAEERGVLERAAQTLERLALPASHPGRG
jgi:DNA-binding MarR family transcriptional regulator